jgi:O-antigen/teichoic acid export membrane protein
MLTNIYKRKGFRIAVYSVIVPILLQLIYIRYVSYNVDSLFFGNFILYISFIALISSFLFSVPHLALTKYINQTSNKERFINEFLTMQIPLNIIGIIAIYVYCAYSNSGFNIFLILSIYFVLLTRYSISKIIIFQLIKRKQFFNISVLEKLARFFFPVLIFYFFQSSTALLFGLLIGYLILVTYSSYQLKNFQQKFFFSFRKLKIYILFGYPIMAINLAVWIISLSDRYYIENYVGKSIVGEYSIIAQVAGFSSIIASIFTVYVQPIIFKKFSDDKNEAMKNYLSYVNRSLIVFIPIYIVFLFVPLEVFTIIINPSIILNDDYFYIFHLLVLASILVAYVTILTNIFILNNMMLTLSKYWLIASLFTIFGNSLIDTYGIYAVAFTKMLAYLLLLLFMYFSINRLMKNNYSE